MVNGRPCEYCKDNNATKNAIKKINHYLHLDRVYLNPKHLTAHEQKFLSKELEVDVKDLRLSFRKKRAKDKKKSETEGKADISTTSSIHINDRVPNYHLIHQHSCNFRATIIAAKRST